MISFNNIPDTIRTPGVFVEVDNSRALKGLVANPHKALIIGDGIIGEGSKPLLSIEAITRDGLADGFFGVGSPLARMCNSFKLNNPNTELHAIRVSGGTAQASAVINFSVCLSHVGAVSTNNEVVKMLLNGNQVHITLVSNWSAQDIGSAFETKIEANSQWGFTATRPSGAAASHFLNISCAFSGELGNYMDVRFNYYEGQSWPTCFDTITAEASVVSNFEGGVGNPDLGDVWAVIQNEQYQHIINPYVDAANLAEIEDELETRFKPLEDKPGHGYTCYKATQANCTTKGNGRNSPHNTILGIYNTPTPSDEIAAALGAQAAAKLNSDPARPLHTVKLVGVLAPPQASRFGRDERDLLLYDGIATYTVDSGGAVMIERCITTYQKNAAGIVDPSYLDIQTLFTLIEIRFQFKAKMLQEYIIPRFKLADDSFPIAPGSYVTTRKTIKQTIVALFAQLRDVGLIENLEDFTDNLIVERNSADQNRVDVLMPPDLINQFRVLAGTVQFIL